MATRSISLRGPRTATPAQRRVARLIVNALRPLIGERSTPANRRRALTAIEDALTPLVHPEIPMTMRHTWDKEDAMPKNAPAKKRAAAKRTKLT